MADHLKLCKCPFCGNKAKTKHHEPMPPEIPNAWWTVECSHATQYHYRHGTGCPVMPMASGDTLDEAVKCWNTREGTVRHG